MEAYDVASRTGGDISTSISMGSVGDKGMSMGTIMGSDRDMGMSIGKPEERQSACILAGEGDAHSTSAPDPKALGVDMDDPLSKGIPFVGLRLQTGVTRQRPADVKILQATDESASGATEVVKAGVDHTLGNGGCEECTLFHTSALSKKRRPRFVS